MSSVQGDTSGSPGVGYRHPPQHSLLTYGIQYRLLPCRHLFCIGCILKAFREQGEHPLWYTCPQCTCTVGTTPPRMDRGVEPIASWLRAASGADMPSTDEVMGLERELVELCSWDRNKYLINGGNPVVDPSLSSHSTPSTPPV